MNAELVISRFQILPENLQQQALDYVEFLIQKYSIKVKQKPKEIMDEELSPELKALLDERIENHRKNPEKVVTWQQVKTKIEKTVNELI